MSITLTLEIPISANRYWRTFMPKGFKAPVTTLSSEAKAYKASVAKIAKAAGISRPITGRVHVDIKLFPNRPLDWKRRMTRDPLGWDDTVQCLDLDNCQKCLLDSLKGVVMEDDKFVRRITAERMEPDGEARVVVTITAIEVAQPQAGLFAEA